MAQSKHVGETIVYYITRVNNDNELEKTLQFFQSTGTFNFRDQLEDGTGFEDLERAKGIKKSQEYLAQITGQNVEFKLLKQVQTTTEEEAETTEQTSK